MLSYKVPENLLGSRHDERFYNRNDLETICEMLTLGQDTMLYPFSYILATIGTGKGISKEEQGFGNIAYLKVGNMSRYLIDYTETETVSEDVVRRNKMKMLESGDILISRVGTVGNVCMYRDNDPPATPSDNVLLLTAKELDWIRPFYICIFLNSPFGQAQIRRLSKQSLQEVINQTSIRSLLIPCPSIETQITIEDTVTEHLSRITELKKQIETEREKAGERVSEVLFNQTTDDYHKWDIKKLMEAINKLAKQANENSEKYMQRKILRKRPKS